MDNFDSKTPKILIVADSPSWAIGKLSQAIIRHNSDMEIDSIYVHPKEVEQNLPAFKEKLKLFNPTVIHFQYWNTAQQLIKLVPEIKEKKLMLTHHNQKNLLSEDWNVLGIQKHICHTKKSKDILEKAGYKNVQIIQHGIQINNFEFSNKLQNEKTFGYAGRIVPWKGLKEIAQAAREIGFPVTFMGKMDKMDYWNEIPDTDKENMDMTYLNCKDTERREAYYAMRVFVCNSADDREEGPLPLLEAMACGIPVVTTPCGEAADICKHNENALVVPFGDYGALKEAMKTLIFDDELAEKLRQKAWETVKSMDERKMALEYRRAYKKVFFGDKPLVSVIIPFHDKSAENLPAICEAYFHQTYSAVEVLAGPDYDQGYNLAKVRNELALIADGEILLFNDSRIIPEKDAVENIVKYFVKPDGSLHKQKVWYFGDKGNSKATFVENFSAILREHYFHVGGCNQMINKYGAMSQELRERFSFAGFEFMFCPDFQATTLSSSHKTLERRKNIADSKFMLYRMGLV